MKICYFIQTHKSPEQVYRLVRTIKNSSPDAQILINHNFLSCHLDMAPLQNLSDIHLLSNNEPLIRANFSCQVRPYLNAINWLFENNSDFDWLINITGQDYPTQSLAKIESFLSQTEYDAFIRYWDVSADSIPWDKEKGFKRYYCHYMRLPKRNYQLLKKLQNNWLIKKYTPLKFYLSYGPLVGVPVKSTPFNDKFICYGGWAWYTLNRKSVQYIRDFANNQPKIVDYYQKTVVPEESFVQTILVNSQRFNINNDDKRYIDYTRAIAGSPRILSTNDYATLTDGNYHFARKFELEQNSELLDMLDAQIFATT